MEPGPNAWSTSETRPRELEETERMDLSTLEQSGPFQFAVSSLPQVMFADRGDRGGLGPFRALALGDDQANLAAHVQVCETVVHNAVAMEVDLLPVRKRCNAVALMSVEGRNRSVDRHLVGFDLAGGLA